LENCVGIFCDADRPKEMGRSKRGELSAALDATEIGRNENGCGNYRSHEPLSTETKLFNCLQVTLVGLSLQIIEKFPALSHHCEQTTPGREVLFVITHVAGEMLDALREKRDLVISTASVLIVELEVFQFNCITHILL
jgi:hypothetical protein